MSESEDPLAGQDEGSGFVPEDEDDVATRGETGGNGGGESSTDADAGAPWSE